MAEQCDMVEHHYLHGYNMMARKMNFMSSCSFLVDYVAFYLTDFVGHRVGYDPHGAKSVKSGEESDAQCERSSLVVAQPLYDGAMGTPSGIR